MNATPETWKGTQSTCPPEFLLYGTQTSLSCRVYKWLFFQPPPPLDNIWHEEDMIWSRIFIQYSERLSGGGVPVTACCSGCVCIAVVSRCGGVWSPEGATEARDIVLMARRWVVNMLASRASHNLYVYSFAFFFIFYFFYYFFFFKLSFLPLQCCNCRGVKRRYWKLTPLWDWDGVKSEWGGRVWEPWCCRLNALMRLCLPWKRTSTGVKQNTFCFLFFFVCLTSKNNRFLLTKSGGPLQGAVNGLLISRPIQSCLFPHSVLWWVTHWNFTCYHVEIFSCSVCDASAGFFPSHRYAAFINDSEFSCLY